LGSVIAVWFLLPPLFRYLFHFLSILLLQSGFFNFFSSYGFFRLLTVLGFGFLDCFPFHLGFRSCLFFYDYYFFKPAFSSFRLLNYSLLIS
jgi:hypothetical protein